MAKRTPPQNHVEQMLDDIYMLLDRIARNQDVDHDKIVNLGVRSQDIQNLTENLTTEFQHTSRAIGQFISNGSTASLPQDQHHVERQEQNEQTKHSKPMVKVQASHGAEPVPDDPFASMPVIANEPVTEEVVALHEADDDTDMSSPVLDAKHVDIEDSKILANIQDIVKNTQMSVDGIYAMINNMARQIADSYRYASADLLMTLQSQKPDVKHILITGFYGAPNLGDELMCLTLLDYLNEYLPEAELTVMCTNSDTFDYADAYFGVNILHYPRGFYDENVIANSYDALIIGGGALIDDSLSARGLPSPGMMNISRVTVELPLAFENLGKPVAMLGLSSASTLTDLNYISKTARAIMGARATTIRDPYSLATLASTGIPEDRMNLSPDIVASNKILQEIADDTKLLLAEKAEYEKTSDENPTCNIAVSWIPSDNQSTQNLVEFINEVARIADDEYKEVGIYLIPFCEEFNTDSKMISMVRAMVTPDARDILHTPAYSQDIGALCDLLATCDYAVNMRYHGAYLAGIMGLPGIGVVWNGHAHYPNKMQYVNDLFPDIAVLDSSKFNPKVEARAAIDAMFGSDIEDELDSLGFDAVARPNDAKPTSKEKHSVTALNKRIERIEKAAQYCNSARENMDTIMSRLSNSINRS